jgi:drug/metabolite transporter (DMT)-like permease
MVGMAVGCAPLQLAIDPSGLLPGFTLGELAGFAWLALPSGGLAHIAANTAVRRMPAGRSSAFLFLVPLSGAVIAAIFLGERLDPGQLTGGALIVAAIVVATVPAAWLQQRARESATDRR